MWYNNSVGKEVGMTASVFVLLYGRRSIYCMDNTRFDVLVPGRIKWLENIEYEGQDAIDVLVPGRIKWLENPHNHYYL